MLPLRLDLVPQPGGIVRHGLTPSQGIELVSPHYCQIHLDLSPLDRISQPITREFKKDRGG